MALTLPNPLLRPPNIWTDPNTGQAAQGFLQYLTALDTLMRKGFVQRFGLNPQVADYVLAAADAGQTIEMNVGIANTLTIPANATIAIPVGAFFRVAQIGAGQTTLVAAGGVTIRTRVGLKIIGQFGVAEVYKRGADEWLASGDLAA